MTASSVPYQGDSSLSVRFLNHTYLGLKGNLPGHEWDQEKYIERAGDFLLWSVERLPKIIWEKLKDPRAVTIALTALALLSNSSLFYPVLTRMYLAKAIAAIPLPPFWMVKFAAYIHTCSVIIGAASRAYGRFANEALMRRFYNNEIGITT